MERMYFRNYSITCYGPNDGLPKLLQTICEGKPVIMDGGQLMVASFSSAMRLDEIETLLKDKFYSFMIFEMDPESSRGYTVNEVMQERLFDDFFYKKIELEDLNDIAPNFSGTNEYIEYEDIDSSKLHSDIYLQDLLDTLQEALEDEEYEYAGEVRDEIKEVDPEFYEKNVKNNKFLG
jgi:hypothetical protein